MPSLINPNIPKSGTMMDAVPIEANFKAAHDEITALQTGPIDGNTRKIQIRRTGSPSTTNDGEPFYDESGQPTLWVGNTRLLRGTFTTEYSNVWFNPPASVLPIGQYHGGNTVMGYYALGVPNFSRGINNTAIGYRSLYDLTAGAYNVGVGNELALGGGVPGGSETLYNIMIGAQSYMNAPNCLFMYNTAIGSQINMSSSDIGVYWSNVAIGYGHSLSATDMRVIAGSYSDNTILGYANYLNGSVTSYNSDIIIGKANNLQGTCGEHNDLTVIGINNRLSGSVTQYQQTMMLGDNHALDGGPFYVDHGTVIGSHDRLNGSITTYANPTVVGSDNNLEISVTSAYRAGVFGSYNRLYASVTDYSDTVVFGNENNLETRDPGHFGIMNTVIGTRNYLRNGNFAKNFIIGGSNSLYAQSAGTDFVNNILFGTDNHLGSQTANYRFENNVIVGKCRDVMLANTTNMVGIGHDFPYYGSNNAHIGSPVSGYNISFGNGTQTAFFQRTCEPRFKENISDADAARCLADVVRLKVKRFSYKAALGEQHDKTVTGFMADDFAEVFPKAVMTSSVMFEDELTEAHGIDQSQLVPTLVAAVQALAAQVQALSGEPASRSEPPAEAPTRHRPRR